MNVVYLRFYAELNEFLPPEFRQRTFTYPLQRGNTVKHVIEAVGVPHTEVELALVNGVSRGFAYHLNPGDQVSIYPVFESFEISSLLSLRPSPLREVRFILDTHLGKLANYLRLMGFDTLYRNDLGDDALTAGSIEERRILLTRDTGLLKRKEITHGHYVRSIRPREQLVEVMQHYQLYELARPFSRCLLCNGVLELTPQEAIDPRLITEASKYYTEFYRCQGCRQVYWKGSHYARMKDWISQVLEGQSQA